MLMWAVNPLTTEFFSSVFAKELKRGSYRLPTHRRGVRRKYFDDPFLKGN